MPDRTLPDHPSLEEYKKQAKELHRSVVAGIPAALNAFIDTIRAFAMQDQIHCAPSAWPMRNSFSPANAVRELARIRQAY